MWNWPTTICLAQLRTIVFVTLGYVMDMMTDVIDMMDMMTMLYDDKAQYMMTMFWIGYDVKWGS